MAARVERCRDARPAFFDPDGQSSSRTEQPTPPYLHVSLETLVRKLTDLPPALKILHKLERLLASPEDSLDQIAGILVAEPGMSATGAHKKNAS
jgi:hypothetical protein